MTVDVIIPVYHPGRDERFLRTLERLHAQTLRPGRIILMNTEESLYTPWAEAQEIAARFPEVVVRHTDKASFDHAATRNEGATLSDADAILFMTMDAVPAGTGLIERLADALNADHNCAAVYARQQAGKDAREEERFARHFNYPETSLRKTADDEPRLGIKAYFLSNVCAMYRRDRWQELGGFSAPAIFNEDMVFARAALHEGYSIRYCAEAVVIHAHNYTAADQFHRNFDLGVSQAMHPEVFGGVRSEGEGKKFVTGTVRYLFSKGRALRIPGFLITCAARYAGFLLGRHYRRLPRAVIMRCTNQKEFWK